MDFAFLILSFILGALLAGLFVHNRIMASGQFLQQKVVQEKYILRDLADDLQMRYSKIEQDLLKKQAEWLDLNKDLASLEQINANLEDKLETQKQTLEKMQIQLTTTFENLASRLLEEKSQRFSDQNRQQMEGLLSPLKEQIRSFETGIEQKFLEDLKQRVSLKSEIENLHKLNQQLSSDAHNLVTALRGDNKKQGNWGELQLETLLEKAGLLRGVHFRPQMSYTDEKGATKRPDFIIELPDAKQIVIDSKVSLTAYEQFFSAEDDLAQARFLKNHIESIRTHARGLSEKNYAGLYDINTPDYVLMFVPIEPALAVAMQKDALLYTDAIERNVLIVTPTTLLATMRTVAFIWRQENQKRNVLEIARQSGFLYDKFVAFIEDLKLIGNRLDAANSAYNDAMNKLTDSKKFGDTLVGRAEKIRELGAKTTKTMPKDLLE